MKRSQKYEQLKSTDDFMKVFCSVTKRDTEGKSEYLESIPFSFELVVTLGAPLALAGSLPSLKRIEFTRVRKRYFT